MKENILVSACLLGLPCRYDGESREYPEILGLKEKYNLIPVCPEIYGGLPTPRVPSERVGERVITHDGRDVTDNYIKGAESAYRLCEIYGCKRAILKAKSPACGSGKIYDGSFTRTLTDGDGVTAEYLRTRGVAVFDESESDKLKG